MREGEKEGKRKEGVRIGEKEGELQQREKMKNGEYLFWSAALRAPLRFSEPHSENWRNKTQREMRGALKHPTVVTGYLEGSASSLICLVWLETPNQTLNPQSQRKPTEFNSRW